MLIIVCGLPGSGKTTLARELAGRVHAVHFSSDALRKKALAKPTYSEDEKMLIYDELARMAAASLAEGKDVIVDATYYSRMQRERMRKVAQDAGAKSFTLLCVLSEEETRRRLSRRKPGGISDADFGVYLKIRMVFEPLDEPHLEVDGSITMERMLKLILDFIGER